MSTNDERAPETESTGDEDPQRHLRELRRITRLYAALTHINQTITRAPERVELFRRVCETLVDQGGFAMAWIGWRAPGTSRLEPKAAAGLGAGYLDSIRVYTDERLEGLGPAGTAVREARAYVCNDVLADPRMGPWREACLRHRFAAITALPIRFGGEVAGSLNVYAHERYVFRDEEVALLGEVAADITFALENAAHEEQRRIAQAEARLELEFSTTMLESLPGVFYFYDERGRFLRWNENFEAVSGYCGEEIARMHPLEFIAPEDRATVEERIGRVLEEGEATVEAGLLAKDGRVTPYFFTGKRLLVDGGRHLLGMGVDIGERKRAEGEVLRLNADLERRVAERTTQLEQANQGLEAFSYSVSHDLRAPLRAMNGLAEVVAADYGAQLPEEGRRLLRRIRERAVHMGNLIDDLLAFSRCGRQPLRVGDVDMGALARRAAEELAPQYAGRALGWEITDLPPCRGDPKLLYQVWLNLLSNAVKYSRGRDPAAVRIDSVREDPETVYRVSDNGAGFDMRYADKLFGVFQRLHRADEFEGTGVGLAIVKSIVQRHGGRVWATAAENRGATFFFTIR